MCCGRAGEGVGYDMTPDAIAVVEIIEQRLPSLKVHV